MRTDAESLRHELAGILNMDVAEVELPHYT
jgi:hypothetical protein